MFSETHEVGSEASVHAACLVHELEQDVDLVEDLGEGLEQDGRLQLFVVTRTEPDQSEDFGHNLRYLLTSRQVRVEGLLRPKSLESSLQEQGCLLLLFRQLSLLSLDAPLAQNVLLVLVLPMAEIDRPFRVVFEKHFLFLRSRLASEMLPLHE